jgi:flagellin-like protein
MIDTTAIRDRIEAYRTGDRGVSPVIGVILMVAITVILAAVIGAFVLQLNQGQDTAPQSSFGANQQEVQNLGTETDGSTPTAGYTNTTPDRLVELNRVNLRLKGGDNIQQQDIRVGVRAERNGTVVNGLAYGYDNETSSLQAGWNSGDRRDIKSPTTTGLFLFLTEGFSPSDSGATVGSSPTVGIAMDTGGNDEYVTGEEPDTVEQFCDVGALDPNDANGNDSTITLLDDDDGGDAPNDCSEQAGNDGSPGEAWTRVYETTGDFLRKDDTVRVTWSPVGSDQSQVLREYTLE